jgi:hypothetical protein
MFLILIVLGLLQLWLIFAGKSNFEEIRLAFVKASVLIFALIFLNTEILSALSAVNSFNLGLFWIAENLLCLGFLFFENRNNFANYRQSLHAAVFVKGREKLFSAGPSVAVLVSIYAAIFAVAVFSVPNTADSQTYHLARVANWIQWQNVDFYPTATLRQLYSNPLAEYGILNILLLSGDDRFANLLQFGCLIGCGVTVSLIAREFKTDFAGQALAWLLTATIPIAVLQASSTQNDLVTTFFALNFFLFYLRASQSADARYGEIFFCALTAGLALLTKGTAYIYCAAIGAVIFGYAFFGPLPRARKAGFFANSLVILLIALSLNSIQYTRNYRLFGAPITTGDESYGVKNITPRTAAAGIVKNYAIHLGAFVDSSPAWIERQAQNLFGDALDNPDTNFLEMKFGVEYSDHEDKAGNFILIIVLTICLLLLIKYKNRLDRNVFIGALAILAGFVLAAVLLRWNPWLSRLQIPFFMLGCAVIAAVLRQMNERGRILAVILCLLGSLNALLLGQPRSILSVVNSFSEDAPRARRYFANQPGIADSYLKAAAVIRENDPPEVGLVIESDYRRYNFGDWEYPVWTMLKDDFSKKPLVRHVGLKNVSNRLARMDRPLPEWLITSGQENIIDGVRYDEVWSGKPLRVLRKSAE